MNIYVAMVEKAIGKPSKEWEGNCYAIACAILDAKVWKGTARFGIWNGPISPASRFYRGAGKFGSYGNATPHGWIEAPDKSIIDPTRWVFEAAPPYIYFGENDHYDLGGNGLKGMLLKGVPCPAFDGKKQTVLMPDRGKTRDAINTILPKGAAEGNKLTTEQIHWLAIQPPSENSKLIYEWLVKKKLGAFIPVDNKQLILGGAPSNL